MQAGTAPSAGVPLLSWNDAKKNLMDAMSGLVKVIGDRDKRIAHAIKMIDFALQSADPSQKVFLTLAKELLK